MPTSRRDRLSWPIVATGLWLVISQVVAQATTLVVTNLADNGPGTLRSVLTNAHNGDVITFAVTGTITNTATYAGFIISNSVAILGPGAEVLAVSGNKVNRVFNISSGVVVSMSGLTIFNGYGGPSMDGGGIYNAGSLALTNCAFTACRSTLGGVSLNNGGPGFAAGNGGAIFNSDTLVAVNCLFLTNAANAGGAGSAGYGSSMAITPGGNGGNGGHGGAVYDSGTASFLNCAFGWNTAGAGGRGGNGGSASSSSPGAGRYGGSGGNGGHGGAVFSVNGVSFKSCTFANNSAGAGGAGGSGGNGYYYLGGYGGWGGIGGSSAVYCTGTGQVVACTFTANTAGAGGSGAAGGTGGTGYQGGYGGNGASGGNGGAFFGNATNALISFRNVLAAQNTAGSAGSAGGGGASGSGWPGPAASSGTNGLAGTGPDLLGAFTSLGHNLIGLRTGNTGFTNSVLSDLVGTNSAINAKLGALTNNGGFTRTCALLSGSPALDVGDDAITNTPLPLTSDERGYPRRSGAHVDIGAYELQWPATPFLARSATSNGVFVITLTNVPGAAITVLFQTDVTKAMTTWPALGLMTETAAGQYQWTDTTMPSRALRYFRVRSP